LGFAPVFGIVLLPVGVAGRRVDVFVTSLSLALPTVSDAGSKCSCGTSANEEIYTDGMLSTYQCNKEGGS